MDGEPCGCVRTPASAILPCRGLCEAQRTLRTVKRFALFFVLLFFGVHSVAHAEATPGKVRPSSYPFAPRERPLRSGINLNDIHAGHAILTRSGPTVRRGRNSRAELRFINAGPAPQWFYRVFSPPGVLALYDAKEGRFVRDLLAWQGGSAFIGFSQSDWTLIPAGSDVGTTLTSTTPVNVPAGAYSLQMIFFAGFIAPYPSRGMRASDFQMQPPSDNNIEDGEIGRISQCLTSRQEVFRSNVVKVQVIEERK